MKQRHKRKQCLKIKHYNSILVELRLLFKPYTTFHEVEGNHESLEVVVDFSLVKPKIKALLEKLKLIKTRYKTQG